MLPALLFACVCGAVGCRDRCQCVSGSGPCLGSPLGNDARRMKVMMIARASKASEIIKTFMRRATSPKGLPVGLCCSEHVLV